MAFLEGFGAPGSQSGDFLNSDLFQGLTGLAEQYRASQITQSAAAAQASTIMIGGQIAAQGLELTSAGYRQSAESVKQATVFNLEIDKTNNYRSMQATNRQLQRTLGKQLKQQAATGLSVGSKSFIQTRNETLDVFGTAMLNMKLDNENRRRTQVFQSEIQQTNLENQARASDFRAQAERVMASNRAANASFQGDLAAFKTTQSIIKSVPTLLSQAFQE